MKLFLLFALAELVSAQVAVTSLPACTGTRVRREIRDLSQAERDAFFNGIKKLVSSGVYTNLVKRHTDASGGFWNSAHFTPFFLPIHRCYLRDFEDALRSVIGPNFALPYWDWSLDSQNPGASVIFTADYYGSNNPQSGYIVQDGPFSSSSFKVPYPSPHNLVRQYQGSNMSTFYHPSLLANILRSNRTFSDMSFTLENTAHANVHTNIGGNNGDMTTRQSPNDPLFWAHHAFIDKLWADWQAQGSNGQKFDGNSYVSTGGSKYANLDSSAIIEPYGIPVSKILNTASVCVGYAQPGSNADSLSVDNSMNVTSIKPPNSLPDAWFNKTGANKTAVQALDNQTQLIAEAVNKNMSMGLPWNKPPTANIGSKTSSAVGISINFMTFALVASTVFF